MNPNAGGEVQSRSLAGNMRIYLQTALASLLATSCVEADADVHASSLPAPAAHSSQVPAKSAEPPASPSSSPSKPSIEQVLAALPEDPAPPKIIRQTHYFVSNEPRPEAFRLQAEGLGGIYIGVGAEQNYLFAGWARPKVMILADFDQWVVDVHFIHGVLMRDAPDPEAFVASWSRNQRERARELITKAAPNGEARQRLLDMFKITRSGVYSKLLNMRVGYRGRGVPMWLTEQAQYDHVANLYRNGHARALRGDFTGSRTLAGIAQAAKTLEIPVRAIYLSNVEDYFHYSSGLGRNLLAQPIDDRSVLLRTLASGEDYKYVAQRLVDFRSWLAVAGVDHRLDIFAGAPIQHGPRGKFIGGPPAADP